MTIHDGIRAPEYRVAERDVQRVPGVFAYLAGLIIGSLVFASIFAITADYPAFFFSVALTMLVLVAAATLVFILPLTTLARRQGKSRAWVNGALAIAALSALVLYVLFQAVVFDSFDAFAVSLIIPIAIAYSGAVILTPLFELSRLATGVTIIGFSAISLAGFFLLV